MTRSPESGAAHSVRVIADDLTGACDAAVAFACKGMKTEVQPEWTSTTTSEVQVLAQNTESRDIGAGDAALRICEIAEKLNGDHAHHLLKKTDSVFRGNTFVEIASCVKHFRYDLAILAPASPDHGRTVVDGVLHVRDLAGERTVDLEKELTRAGVALRKVSAEAKLWGGMPPPQSAQTPLLLCDAGSHADMMQIVQAGMQAEQQGRILWIGSSGLAHAIADVLAPEQSAHAHTVQPGTVVFVIGSNHPITLMQVDHLKKELAADRTMHARGSVILGVSRHIAPAKLRRQIEDLDVTTIACIFVTGGDTAMAVCRALEIERLQVQREFARGVPQSVAVGGPLSGQTLILKSGGFGEVDVLSRIARTFAPEMVRQER